MKIHGGIKEIVNNQVSLNQYFIIAPEISSIVDKVYTFFGITDSDDQEHHYQLKGCKNKRISDNVEKLTTVFDYHNTKYEEPDCSITPSIKIFYQKNLRKCF